MRKRKNGLWISFCLLGAFEEKATCFTTKTRWASSYSSSRIFEDSTRRVFATTDKQEQLQEPEINTTQHHGTNSITASKKTKRGKKRRNSMTIEEASQVESNLLDGLEAITITQHSALTNSAEHKASYDKTYLFPSVRECNAAIAAFGDDGDFLRGLRMFVKMRKAASLQHSRTQYWDVPAPTLVTYSTLMSRAVQCNKIPIALRLWNLMKLQSEFFTHFSARQVTEAMIKQKPQLNDRSVTDKIIIPDTKAANILMNTYAKLGDDDAAQNLLSQMLADKWEAGADVPPLVPNLVTYNTLIDACRRSGELVKGLQVLQEMKCRGIQPDARTYTSLISTVARRRKRPSKQGKKSAQLFGSNDPDMAFTLLSEMVHEQRIRPNGITYCALIDVCGRCGRADLALKGLRMMLHQKKQEEEGEAIEYNGPEGKRKFVWSRLTPEHREAELSTQIGAWTAAINACGRGGRVNTAIRLFRVMQNPPFYAMPNTVTCGCLTDCLLRAEDHPQQVADIIDVLRYMKQNNLEPSEVMYTSLIASAGRLVQKENSPARNPITTTEDVNDESDSSQSVRLDSAKAIDVYTELMKAIMRGRSPSMDLNETSQFINSTLLLKVFLVFQEMRSAGATPDIASYNALLRACAQVGDFDRAKEVISWIRQNDGVEPNRYSWTQALRAASRSSFNPMQATEEMWNIALSFQNVKGTSSLSADEVHWKPNVDDLEILHQVYWSEANSSSSSRTRKIEALQRIVNSYSLMNDLESHTESNQRYRPNDSIIGGLEHVSLIDTRENQRLMLVILQAAVKLHLAEIIASDLACHLIAVPILKRLIRTNSISTIPQQIQPQALKALSLAESWRKQGGIAYWST